MVTEHTLEETLDPKDWEELKKIGHQMIDDMIDRIATVRQRPPMKFADEKLVLEFMKPLPLEPQELEEVYDEFKENMMNQHMGLNTHPRFWGWVVGAGTAQGALAEMLATGINFNMPGGPFIPVLMESQVLEWFKNIFRFPKEASGLLVGGGSEANLLGIAVARNAKAGFDVRKLGQVAAVKKMIIYASTETHVCIDKAVQLLGLGMDNFKKIPVDENYQIRTDHLSEEIRKDKNNGLAPFCIVGNAGTTNTGSFDDLNKLAEICADEGLWLHVDGALGAWATINDSTKALVNGMEKADSLAFDLHKSMNMPYDVACILIRNEEAHYKTFAEHPDYFGGSRTMKLRTDYGLQVSRYFRSLKVWMGLKEHGLNKFGRLIKQNFEQAQYLAKRIESSKNLELMAPTAFNVVCFRYKPHGFDDDALNEINNKINNMLTRMGVAVLSTTKLNSKTALRACIVNHRSNQEDFDLLLSKISEIGETVK